MKYLLILILASSILFSQDEPEIKSYEWGEKTIPGFNKRVYIKDFKVNYQLMINWMDRKQGGRQFGGGVKGSATAQLFLGVPSLSTNVLQKLTDSLYNLYVDHLIKNGYFIVNNDEISDLEIWDKYELIDNTAPEKNEFPGIISFKPSQRGFYQRKKKKYFDSFFAGMAMNHPYKIAKEHNCIVSEVILEVSLFEDSESGFTKIVGKLGGGANLEATTRLKLNQYSKVQFAYPEASLTYNPEDGYPIQGVFEEKEYSAYQSQDRDYFGTSYDIGSDYAVLTIYEADDLTFKNMQSVECDPIKYYEGVLNISGIFFDKAIKTAITNY